MMHLLSMIPWFNIYSFLVHFAFIIAMMWLFKVNKLARIQQELMVKQFVFIEDQSKLVDSLKKQIELLKTAAELKSFLDSIEANDSKETESTN